MTDRGTLTLTIGIPSSGKSTWVREQLVNKPSLKVISTDSIRGEVTGEFAKCFPEQNQMIHDIARERAKEFIEKGVDVIVDSTNVDWEEWKEYRALNPKSMNAKIFLVPPERAMKQQENRDRKVPAAIIEQKWKTLQANISLLAYYFNSIIF